MPNGFAGVLGTFGFDFFADSYGGARARLGFFGGRGGIKPLRSERLSVEMYSRFLWGLEIFFESSFGKSEICLQCFVC